MNRVVLAFLVLYIFAIVGFMNLFSYTFSRSLYYTTMCMTTVEPPPDNDVDTVSKKFFVSGITIVGAVLFFSIVVSQGFRLMSPSGRELIEKEMKTVH